MDKTHMVIHRHWTAQSAPRTGVKPWTQVNLTPEEATHIAALCQVAGHKCTARRDRPCACQGKNCTTQPNP